MKMMAVIAVLVVCLIVQATSAEDCPNSVTCPCGNKGKNVTFCASVNALAQVCKRFEKCEDCVDGLTNCSKCPDGFKGAFCSQEISGCPNPGLLEHGHMRYFKPGLNRPGGKMDHELDEYEVGTVLKYFCLEGFMLQGPDTITCQPTGSWSPKRPSCVKDDFKLTCENPGTVLNGKVWYFPPVVRKRRNETRTGQRLDEEMDEYPSGSELKYSCDEGFQLRGSDTLMCERTGFWSAEPPSCVGDNFELDLMCENPGSVLNGKVRYFAPVVRKRNNVTRTGQRLDEEMDEYPSGSVLKYSCDERFRLRGSDTLMCEETGFWSAERPSCVGDCGQSFVHTDVRTREKTLFGEWPWVVSISYEYEKNRLVYVCGGALINTHTVLTAGNCLETGRTYILRFGKHHYRIKDDDPDVVVRTSSRVVIHPDFNRQKMDSDIGLIMFEPALEYSVRVQPVCLPTIETTVRNIRTGRVGYISGWSLSEDSLPSDTLLFAGMPVLSMRDCVESYRKANVDVAITGNMFCAVYYNGTNKVCTGSGGSPFVFYDFLTKRYTLEGLVSYMIRSEGSIHECGAAGKTVVFTKVFRFVPWIYHNME